jgi:hypothetical protein
MSLLKPKEKNPAPSTMTAVDKAEAQLTEILKDTEAANERARERILALGKSKTELKKQYNDRAERIRIMAADYKKILSETQAQEAEAIGAEAVTKEDLKAGRVNITEFLKVGKKAEQIQKEARTAALEKMGTVRDSVRALMLEQYILAVEIAAVEEKISEKFSEVAGTMHHKLSGMIRVLESQGVTGSGIQTAHFQKAEADNNLGMARSGSTIYHGRQWKVESVEDVRALALDPIVQIVHLAELEALALDLEGRDFPLTVNYLPNAAQGRGPGFWFYPGPKIQEARHG